MKKLVYQLKKFRRDARILLNFGTLHPERIALAGSDHDLYVDPRDPRARKMIIYKSLRGHIPRNQLFWQRACSELAPALAIDVGANYGECLFGTDYSAETRVIGVEANASLMPYLERSRSIHSNQNQIELHNVLAASESAAEVPFWVMKGWSGGSTAVANRTVEDQDDFKKKYVAARSIDEIVGPTDSLPPGPVVFKVDVEGFEPDVLDGMSRLISSGRSLIGIIEFDESYLASAGTDIDCFWESMQKAFDVYWFTDDRHAVCLSGQPYDSVSRLVSRKRIHSDVMLVSKHSADVFRYFLQSWVTSDIGEPESQTRAA